MPEEDKHLKLVLEHARNKVNQYLKTHGKYVDEKEAVYVIYARRSTKDNERQERSIPDQIEDCQAILEDLEGKPKPVKIFKEKESAKISSKRPKFDEMIQGIKEGKWNSIVSWHPNRLARNMLEGGMIIDLIDKGLLRELKFHEYRFIPDSSGKMTLGFHFIMAKQYSDNLSEASTRGTNKIAKEGKSPTNKAKYGYKLVGRYYRPDGDNFAILKEGLQLVADGISLINASKHINQKGFQYQGKPCKMTKQKLSRICNDTFYAGVYVFGEQTIKMWETDHLFTPMLTPLEYNTIQVALGKGVGFKNPQAKTVLFRKMVKCYHCGNFMSPGKPKSGGKSGYRYYELRCTSVDCPTAKKENNFPRVIKGRTLHQFVYELLGDGFEVKPEAYDEYVKSAKPALENIRNDIRQQLANAKRQVTENEQLMAFKRTALGNAKGKTIDELNAELDTLRDERVILDAKAIEVQGQLTQIEHNIESKLMSSENFLNLFKRIGIIAKNSDNQLLIDNIIRTIFLNFTAKDKKVLNYQLNPDFEKLVILPSVSDCRQYGTKLEFIYWTQVQTF